MAYTRWKQLEKAHMQLFKHEYRNVPCFIYDILRIGVKCLFDKK